MTQITISDLLEIDSTIKRKEKGVEVQATTVGEIKKRGEDFAEALEELKRMKEELNVWKAKLFEGKKSVQIVSPLEIHGSISENEKQINPLDYDQILNGEKDSTPFSDDVKNKLRELLNTSELPPAFEQDLILSHREFDVVLDILEKTSNDPEVYILCCVSLDDFNHGMMYPLSLCLWFQRTLNIPVVIQIADNERFYLDNIAFDKLGGLYKELAAQIIAMGFDSSKTYIFNNISFYSMVYPNLLRVQKVITVDDVMSMFSISFTSGLSGIVTYPAFPVVATLSSSFPFFKTPKKCLAIYSCDKDAYYHLARNISTQIGEEPCATLSLKVFPSLASVGLSMASDIKANCLLLSETPKQIQKKINSSFSGGRDTLEEHRELGAILEVDTAFQIFRYLCPSSEEVTRVAEEYKAGRMLTGEMKKIVIQLLQETTKEVQSNVKKSKSEAVLKEFLIC